jgi:hypothetical protein
MIFNPFHMIWNTPSQFFMNIFILLIYYLVIGGLNLIAGTFFSALWGGNFFAASGRKDLWEASGELFYPAVAFVLWPVSWLFFLVAAPAVAFANCITSAATKAAKLGDNIHRRTKKLAAK